MFPIWKISKSQEDGASFSVILGVFWDKPLPPRLQKERI